MLNSTSVVFVDEAPLQFALPQSPTMQLVPFSLQWDFAQILPPQLSGTD